MSLRKKLIEVALPLEAINREAAREKSIRHGHPSTLHLWWARRPLAACRAVLFAQLVDDPSEYMPDEESANRERERLFGILEELVKWENINHEETLDKAMLEIARSAARELGVDVPIGRQAVREFLASQVPPVHSFVLSSKKGRQAWVQPQVDFSVQPPRIRFTVRTGNGSPPQGTVRRTGAQCIVCGTPAALDHIRLEGKAGRMASQLMAVVAEGRAGRVYLPPVPEHAAAAEKAQPAWKPEQELQGKCQVSVPLYGMNTFGDLFTPRQLTALTTFSGMVSEARARVLAHARAAGGRDPQAYADAVATYLAFAVSRLSNRMSTLCFWDTEGEKTQQVFARQALPMTWDFVEANPLCNSTGSFENGFEYIHANLIRLPAAPPAKVMQNDAANSLLITGSPIGSYASSEKPVL